jgi:hypothetical protein
MAKKITTVVISTSVVITKKGQVVKKTSNNSGAGTMPQGVAWGMMHWRRLR